MTTTPFMASLGVHTAARRHKLSEDVRNGAYPVTPDALHRLVAAEDQLTAQADLLAASAETYAGFLTRTAEELVSGVPLPDVATAAQAVVAAEETRRVAGMAIAHLRDAVQEQWTKALAEHLDEMLVGLRPVLEEILAAVRSAAVVVDGLDLTDAESVAAANEPQLAAIGQLKALRPRYRRLRHLQENLLSHALELPPADWGHQGWLGVFKTRAHEFGNQAGYGQPADDLPNVLWFRRLLNRDDVWLPTLSDLDAVLRPQTRRTQHANPDPAHQAALREQEAKTRMHVALLGLNR
jgi:hypothetical protein